MKFLIFVIFLNSYVNCEFDLPENWQDAKDPINRDRYREFLARKFPAYYDFGDEDYEDEGKKEISRHITGGNIAVLGQFDYHVLLYMNDNQGTYLCGASLVKYNWVITAAHCTIDMKSFSLYFGIINRSSSAQWKEEISDFSYIKMHPYYDDDTLQNDISLMFLKRATEELLTFPNVALVALPTFENIGANLTNRDGTVCGFGRTSDSSNLSSNILRYIVRPIISYKECSKIFQISSSIICLNTQGGKSTCQGDSGGGLTTDIEDGNPVLVGIVSFGAILGCQLGYPTGFTAVLSYLDWIEMVFNNTDHLYTTSTFAMTVTSDENKIEITTSIANINKFKIIILFSLIFILKM
ncbi:hypothetical protein PVAND_016616 [Polypedilum vanderplanki]|uniref:Peptidase S1 domain-containing protein n=1 Tax=Polypedilum vanderplanki TaxID=319348 RepID=A0A9J6BGG8_POLVA|nr:hypothetical protein PVAND_016616 [Polypedilum vanderplanki]